MKEELIEDQTRGKCLGQFQDFELFSWAMTVPLVDSGNKKEEASLEW